MRCEGLGRCVFGSDCWQAGEAQIASIGCGRGRGGGSRLPHPSAPPPPSAAPRHHYKGVAGIRKLITLSSGIVLSRSLTCCE